MDPEVRRINANGVGNFDIDVTFLEHFARRLEDPNIADAFLELRQVWQNWQKFILGTIIFEVGRLKYAYNFM